MPAYKKILDCLETDPRGVIVICNIADGLRLGLCSNAFAKKVLRKWKAFHNARARAEGLKRRTWEFKELSRSIELYHSSYPVPSWWRGSSSSDLEMSCRKPLSNSRPARFGSSRSTEQVFEALSDRSMADLRGRLIFFGTASRYFDDDDVIDEIRALPDNQRQFTLKASASIPKYGRTFWFSEARGLGVAFASPKPANAVRDALGLVHYKNDFAATAIFFGNAELAKVGHARPTFGDAATHRRFMIRASLPKNRRRTSWGRTADLSQIAPLMMNCDGVSERVAAAFTGSAHVSCMFTLLPLGKTSGRRGDSANDNDKVFAEFLLRKRRLASLRSALARRGIS